jgi:peptide/nickel transport system substrate-binding protein
MKTSPIDQLKEITPSKRSIKGHLRRIERVSLRHAHKFIVRRFANLRDVQRYALGWLFVVVGLTAAAFWQAGISAQSYTAQVASEGGVYTEGVFGSLDNMNPLFASTPAERAASKLLFASLLTYDNKGDLVGELAEHWQVDDTGRIYTITLRQNAKWQDNIPVTADDVVYTFNLIKDADTRSPLYAGWRNITVEKADNLTVRFTLPVSYAAFLNSLVIGILPQHVLKDLHPSEFRTASFNRQPRIGSGPFQFQDLTSVDTKQNHFLLRTTANPHYVLGTPKLSGFQLHAYKDSDAMPQAFNSQEVAGFSNASLSQIGVLGNPQNYVRINAPLFNGVYAFLKTDSPYLTDIRVRRALQSATNQPSIIKLFNNQVQVLNGPLLPEQLGYRTDINQPPLNLDAAKQALEEAGWKAGADGKRQKDGQPLKLHVVTVSSGNYPAVAEELMRQWGQIGVQFDSLVVRPEDAQQNVIIPRAYDVLIYEIAIGRDPDVYAYWHSTQASPVGLNLSDYRSPKVDDELESARNRLDPSLREAKYRLFVQQWITDVPAIGLYRPAFTYIQNKNVQTFAIRPLVDATDRYFNVSSWAAEIANQHPTR